MKLTKIILNQKFDIQNIVLDWQIIFVLYYYVRVKYPNKVLKINVEC